MDYYNKSVLDKEKIDFGEFKRQWAIQGMTREVINFFNENFDKFNINIFSDKADKIKYNQSNSPRKNISIIKEKSELFIKNFDNPNQKNLLFIGNTGLRENIYV